MMTMIQIPKISNHLDSSSRSESTLVSVVQRKKEDMPQQQQQHQSKKVHFKSRVKVRKISSHRNYSAGERKAVWMSDDESKACRKSAIQTVKKMMKGIDVDASPNDCTRGLESKLPQLNKIRQAKKADIITTVLLEHEIQQEEGYVDIEYLAKVYMENNRECRAEARIRGTQDEIAARGL